VLRAGLRARSGALTFGVRSTIPLFPLPVVLFPGAAMPLHIFEPRYRRMLADALEGDRTFGMACLFENVEERELPAGWVGCIARVEDVASLPDGRSNIVVTGLERFALRALVESDAPYHVASIEPYADRDGDDESLNSIALEVRTLFLRVIDAARTLADDKADSPALPEDAARLSFAIASMIDLDLRAKQALLAERSPAERLRTIAGVLQQAIGPMESRARVHARAKSNGTGPH
jgi:Lon protease-like protein